LGLSGRQVIIQRWAVFRNWSRFPNGYHDSIWILDRSGGKKKKNQKNLISLCIPQWFFKKIKKLTKIK
jgi:hypothetical protein